MKPAALIALLALGCSGTTGSALVTFSAEASGPSDATGSALSFTSGLGAEVSLTRAHLLLGALYLNQSLPASGAAAEPCVSPGIYVAEAFGPLDVDLLSPVPAPFPILAEGTQTKAKTAEVWLTGGDVNASDDASHVLSQDTPGLILDLAGTALQGGVSYPFSAALTIGSNRKPFATSPAMPGASPICHQRIVSPILVDITPEDGGALSLRVDPRPMFNAVDFSLASKTSDDPLAYEIPDTSAGAGGALFKGLIANFGVYSFTWKSRSP